MNEDCASSRTMEVATLTGETRLKAGEWVIGVPEKVVQGPVPSKKVDVIE